MPDVSEGGNVLDVDGAATDACETTEMLVSGERFTSTVAAALDPETVARAWWFAKGPEETGLDRRTYTGLEGLSSNPSPGRSLLMPSPDTLRYLRNVIDADGPFDACLGFSQGGAVAPILSALCSRPHIHPTFADPPLREQGPLKAVIAVSGFKLEEPGTWYAGDDDGTGKISTPSIHIIGDNDPIVGEGESSPVTPPWLVRSPAPLRTDRSLPLYECFERARLLRHEGGHYVPSGASWRAYFVRLFSALRDGDPDVSQIPGPDGPAPSASTMEGAKL